MLPDNDYKTNTDGDICLNSDCTDKLVIEMNGTKPKSNSTVKIQNGRAIINGISLKYDTYTVAYDSVTGKLVATKKEEETSETYSYMKNLHDVQFTSFSGMIDANNCHPNAVITSISFYSDGRTIDNAIEVKDVSLNGDNSVKAYIVEGESGNSYNSVSGKYDSMIIVSDHVIKAPVDASLFFQGYMILTSLNLNNSLDTSDVKDMSGCFAGFGYWGSGVTVNLGNRFDTKNVTDMSGMFSSSSKILNIDSVLQALNTSNVTTMEGMFDHNSSYTPNLDLSNFVFKSNLTTTNMFQYSTYNILVKNASDKILIEGLCPSCTVNIK